MESGVSASGKRYYSSGFTSGGQHLVAGRPYAVTFKAVQGEDITGSPSFTSRLVDTLPGDPTVTVVSPAGTTIDFVAGTDGNAINGVDVVGQLFKVTFPSTMSSVQVSVQETAGTNIATCQARVFFVQPGLDGASSSKSNPEGRGAYVQLGDTPTAPEGAVGFSTAMNQIYILVTNTGAAGASAEEITFLVTGHMPLSEGDITPRYDDLSTFVFSDTSGVG